MKPEDLTVFVIPKNRSIENYNVINYMYPDNQKCLLLMIDDNYSELFELNKYSAKKMMALIENSPATNWQRWKIMLARVISLNFWDKNVPIDERQCRHNV